MTAAEFAPDKRRGRPRDPAIDDAALDAARQLLAEVGWEQTTMVAIADRAGVGKPALYRRWPSKTHLIFEAIFGWVDEPAPIADAHDSADWVRRSFDYTLDLFGRPEVRAALPGLLAALSDTPSLQAGLWRQFGAPGVDMLTETLNAEGGSDAGGSGTAALDAAAAMVLIIGSSMVMRLLLADDDSAPIAARLPDLVRLRGPDRIQ